MNVFFEIFDFLLSLYFQHTIFAALELQVFSAKLWTDLEILPFCLGDSKIDYLKIIVRLQRCDELSGSQSFESTFCFKFPEK